MTKTTNTPVFTHDAKEAVIHAYQELAAAVATLHRAYTAFPELNDLQPSATGNVLPMSIDDWEFEVTALIGKWQAKPSVPKRPIECPVTLRGCFNALGNGGRFRKPSAAERHTYTCQPDTQIWSGEDDIDVLWYPTGDEGGDKPVFYVIDRAKGLMWTIDLTGQTTEAN